MWDSLIRLENIYSCTQCGRCTGLCTATEIDKSYNPREAIQVQSLKLSGYSTEIGHILKGAAPSNCFQCYNCNICPRDVSPGSVMKYLREFDNENGVGNVLGLLRANLLNYGQSIIPEAFYNAGEVWGDSWREVVKRKKYLEYKPQKREISEGVIKEIGYLMGSAKNLKLMNPERKKSKSMNLKNVDEIVLFDSCCGTSHYPGIERSSKYVLDKIGVPYKTLDEQSCCGGFGYYANDLELGEVVLIGARNQGLIENEGCVLVSVCASCFSSNLEVKKLLSRKENKKQINDILSGIGEKVNGSLYIAAIEEVLYDNIDLVKDSIELDLSELNVNVATHSACHYKNFSLRPDKNKILDEIVRATGAKEIDYSLKDRCCGGGFEKKF